MSKSSIRAQSRKARERLRAERERAAARSRRRRRAAISAGVAAAIISAVGLTVVVQSSRAADNRPVVPPAGAVGADKLVISVGQADAPATLTLYEDPRCPGCAQVERLLHTTINRLQDEGKLRVDYHVLSFVDNIVSGTGSKHAANALAAAQNAGRFREYHDALFAAQPKSETDDAFGDKQVLLDLAAKVKGLDTDRFAAAVKDGTHDTWVNKVQEEFDKQTEIQGTPAVFFKGKDLIRDTEHPLTPERLAKLVEAEAEH
ncbi:DsbA family protein [Streptomyces sp. JUS-F4]|uniref:DsbA family protein n=1 Tax=Streptomyces TaxID=1883 RepID=UPI0004AA8B52|nr:MULTISPECIES: thioredoxin domain-containing protein [Streptomyces]WKN12763.1 DsbA family protein [Streptomyces sp. JUS-F4]WKN19264.1 DsbA family protein [Streptomyces sp. JUS-F4]